MTEGAHLVPERDRSGTEPRTECGDVFLTSSPLPAVLSFLLFVPCGLTAYRAVLPLVSIGSRSMRHAVLIISGIQARKIG